MGLESRDERLKKFEKSQIKTPQQQTEVLQKAQAEIGSLTNERQALLRQQQGALQGYQQQLGALQGQASALSSAIPQQPQVNAAQQARAMNAQTQAILQKYGVNPRKPQAGGSRTVQQKPILKSTVAGAGTTNIRTENKTIYNTKTVNSVQVVQPQGSSQITIQKPNIQVAKPVIQLRNQISQQIQAQNQQYERSKKGFIRSDISLRKGADMMMRKIDAASKRFAENMNPQKLAASSTDSTKVLMMLALAYVGTKLIGPISRRIDKLYFWFTGETPEGGEKSEGGGYNKHMGFFDRLKAMVDTKKDDSLVSKIIGFFKDGFEDIKGYLELVFQDRAKAVAAVKGPGDREEWFDMSAFGFKYLPAYIADVFKALVGGTKGLAKSETRKQTKEIENEAKEEVLKNKGLPAESILNGAEKDGIGGLATKAGYLSNQYMMQLTEGGVVRNEHTHYITGEKYYDYSIAQIQQQHEMVRKNVSNPLGDGNTFVATEYAYQLGGNQINIFEDDRTKNLVSRKKLKSISLLPFKLLQFSGKDWKTNDILVKMLNWIKIPTHAALLQLPRAIIDIIIDSTKGEDAEEKKRRRKAYQDIYKGLVKLLNEKAKKGEEKGWQKEERSVNQYDNSFFNAITGGYYYQFEVYFFPVEEENEVKSSVDNLIKSILNKHKITDNNLFGLANYGQETKDVTKIDKELFDVIKKVYDIKEFNTADKNANKYFESMANAKYSWRTGVVNEQGQKVYDYAGDTQQVFTDKGRINEAQVEVDPEWDFDKEKEKFWMTREQDRGELYNNFLNKVNGVASDISDAVVNFRTDDNIEKSSQALNNVAEYLSKSLGIPKDAAIGIVSNLWAESGVNPLALGDNNSSLGVAQWHYKKGIQQVIKNIEDISGIKLKTKDEGDLIRIDTDDPSWKNLKEFSKDNTNYQKLLFGQLDLITKHLKEAKDSSDYGKLYQQLRRSNNPISAEDAAQEFVELFEKPKNKEGEAKKRRDYASQIKRYLDHNYSKEEPQKSEEVVEEEPQQTQEQVNYETVATTEQVYPTSYQAQKHDVKIPYAVQNESPEEKPSSNENQTQQPTQHNVANVIQGGPQVNNVSVINNQTNSEYVPISGELCSR